MLSVSYLATLLWRKGEEDYFPQKLRVRIKDHKNSPHGKFHQFLFPFSSKFSDLNFASYVLYNLPVLCHVSHTVSVGYLCSVQHSCHDIDAKLVFDKHFKTDFLRNMKSWSPGRTRRHAPTVLYYRSTTLQWRI